MRVYARYFESDGIEYRMDTLLQFGDSWELIGNIVLANPGSAAPARRIADDERKLVETFWEEYRKTQYFDQSDWFAFDVDPTMQRIEKIFNGWYVDQTDTLRLDGVIQLFNVFNIKNQNLSEAIDAINSVDAESELLFSKGAHNYFDDKPTYFGFSSKVMSDSRLLSVAKAIFDNSSEAIKSIYNGDFEKNNFYHPTFVSRAHKQSFFTEEKKLLAKLKHHVFAQMLATKLINLGYICPLYNG